MGSAAKLRRGEGFVPKWSEGWRCSGDGGPRFSVRPGSWGGTGSCGGRGLVSARGGEGFCHGAIQPGGFVSEGRGRGAERSGGDRAVSAGGGAGEHLGGDQAGVDVHDRARDREEPGRG